MMTYLMPIVQVFIIWGIKQSYFEWSTDIMNIVLVTNASLYTAILLLVRTTEKDKKVLNTITIFAYVLTVVLFTISMVEINLGLIVFPLFIYKWGALLTLIIALLLGLLCKYDEVKAKSLVIASQSKTRTSVEISDTQFEL